MQKDKEKKWDSNITATRVFLLLSIVSAHSSIRRNEVITGIFIWRIWQVWAIIGVPGFLILSGYLFKGKPVSFKAMWKKKIQNIIIPWALCGTLIYIITQTEVISEIGYLKFMFGYGSFLYYMSVLCGCFLLFYFIFDNSVLLAGCIFLNCVSLLFVQFEVYKSPFTNFLNIANWMGYFAIGCLFRKYEVFSRIKESKPLLQQVLVLGGFVSIIIGTITNVETYFYFMAFPIGCICLLSIYSVCYLTKMGKFGFVNDIGSWAFSVYLLHMPVVAVLKRLVRAINPSGYVLIPLSTVLLFWLILRIINKAGHRNKMFDRITMLIGMR